MGGFEGCSAVRLALRGCADVAEQLGQECAGGWPIKQAGLKGLWDHSLGQLRISYWAACSAAYEVGPECGVAPALHHREFST